MEYVEWNDSLSLGIVKIDAQHKKLVGILNETYEMMMTYADINLFDKKIKELKDYAAEHFDFEEKLMKKIYYPRLSDHREEHKKFVNELKILEKKLDKKKKSVIAEIFLFLKNWLIVHIQKEDRDYADFLLGESQ